MDKNHYVSATSSLNISRSTFDNPNKHTLTTFNAGEVVPIRVLEVIPGDTFNINVKSLVRALTPLNPTMTNMWVTICAIYTPYRVVDNYWYETLGENNLTSWTASNYPEVPSCKLGGFSEDTSIITDYVGSLGHHIGLPLINTRLFEKYDISLDVARNFSNSKISAIYKRTYCENWNEWWRDQNTQSPIIFSKELNESYSDFYEEAPLIPGNNHFAVWNPDDTIWSIPDGTSHYTKYSNNDYSCYLLPANKKHDYFTSAYPSPQKGEAQEFIDTFLPVLASDSVPDKYDLNPNKLPDGVSRDPAAYGTLDGDLIPSSDVPLGLSGGELKFGTSEISLSSGEKITPVNLFAYTGNIATSTINKLRQSIAIQHWNEVSARGGSRRNEILEAHFHIKTNPLMLNKSRYLGGFEFRLSSQTAIATAESENYTVGSTGGYTAAGNVGSLFTSSFDEHGTIMIYAAVRTEQIYSQGIDKMFTRFNRFDFYWDEFKNLGAQPIYNKEIMLTGTPKDDEVFAYNDYADELRVEVNKVSGFLDPVAPNSLSSWTMANNFESLPVYGPDFMKESKANIDRTLAVSSRLTDQFFADFCFDIKKTRILPLSSVPGLTRI